MKATHRTSKELSLDVVLLTAGGSTRLGSPKQHTLLGDTSLLARQLDLADALLESLSQHAKPIVVSGAYLHKDCMALAKHVAPTTHLYNADWERGIKTSLACAQTSATARGVLVILVDQYRLNLDHLTGLYELWTKKPNRPASAHYANTSGPPVIWPQRLWSQQKSEKEALAKAKLLNSNPQFCDMPLAEYDLDTPDDLTKATRFFKRQSNV